MKNKNGFFITFALSLTIGLVAVYATLVRHFNGGEIYQAQIESLQKEVAKERFNSSLLTYQLKDMQQTVAQVLPDAQTLQARYDLRNLAAVTRSPASEKPLDLSGVSYEKGKKFFNSQNYDAAIREFHQLLEKYPLSVHAVEARFFIAESYFLKKDFRSSLSEIDQMVTHYPEHDLTGFILLRMGQISQINNQNEEAAEIYKTVAQNFKNADLQTQARKLAQSVEF